MADHYGSYFSSFRKLLVFLGIILVLIPGTEVIGQDIPRQAATPDPGETYLIGNQLPSVLPGNVWHAEGAARVLTAEQFAIVDGGEVFVEYGLQRVAIRRYRHGRARMMVELFEMRFPSGAFGLHSFNRGKLPAHRQELVAGRYLISIVMESGASVMDAGAVSSVEQLFAATKPGDPLPLISHLPDQNRITGTEKYLIGPSALGRVEGFSDIRDSVDFTGGVEVVTANYQTGNGITKLIIIEYHTPQSATAGYEAAINRNNARSEQEKGRRILKRVGNYIVEAIVEGDSTAAHAIVDKIKYEVKIYWEGKKFSSIPLEFRPPDPAALEEISETATVLIQTFYGIGLMLVSSIVLGVFTGWTVFYWRRLRRRRLGMDDFFSDAGETVRLNLDDYIFQPSEPPIKLLGKGDA